jgi:eukaryotic-like serine/threonine-protein kinase
MRWQRVLAFGVGDARRMHHAARPPILGGYELVRRLHTGRSVVTWLARGDDETVALRMFGPDAPDEHIDSEIAALERLTSDHVPRLIDIATSRSGRPVPVLSTVLGPSLAEVLPGRGLRAGHATTLLAPLAALVQESHEVGVTLGRIDDRAIRITQSGAPVLVAPGRLGVAVPLPERFRRLEPGMVGDREQLRALAEQLAALLDVDDRSALMRVVAETSENPGVFELALFDLAHPLPLTSEPSLETSSQRGESVEPAAGAPPANATRSPRREALEVDGGSRPVSRLARELGLPGDLLAPLDEALTTMARWRRRLARVVSARAVWQRPRPGVIVAGAVGALALCLAVYLSGDEPSSGFPTAEAPDPRISPLASADPSANPGDSSPAAGSSPDSLPDALDEPRVDEWDPLVRELLRRWRECRSSDQASCVGSAAHAGSAAAEQLSAERAHRAAETAVDLPRWLAGEPEPLVVDRMGGAVVVDLLDGSTRTASLLIMRSEAGWRIRTVIP